MSKQIVYARSVPANAEGRTVRNPRHFLKPEEGASKVFIEGHYPHIAKAYEALGVPVADISEMRALPGKAKPKEAAKDPVNPVNPPDEGSSSNSH
jgi:hypothetical protein